MNDNSSKSYEHVEDFHVNFEIPVPRIIQLPEDDVFAFRMDFLQEELGEILDAYNAGNLVKFIDGLIDLVYVAYGTAVLSGVDSETWERLWWLVHSANMCKERAQSVHDSAVATGRGHSFDVIKPEGWHPPEGFMRMLIDAENRRRKYNSQIINPQGYDQNVD